MNSVNCRAFFLLEPRNYALTPLQSNEEPSIVFRVYIRVLAARNRGFKQGAYLNHDAYTRFRGDKTGKLQLAEQAAVLFSLSDWANLILDWVWIWGWFVVPGHAWRIHPSSTR